MDIILKASICLSCFMISHNHQTSLLLKTTEKTDLGSTLSLENGVVGDKESYLLLLKCCKPCFAIYARNKQLLEACDNPEWLALGHIHKEYHQNMYQI